MAFEGMEKAKVHFSINLRKQRHGAPAEAQAGTAPRITTAPVTEGSRESECTVHQAQTSL